MQTFDPSERSLDAELLAAASGESPASVCPPHRGYELALAPPMAARRLGRSPFSIQDLAAELDLPSVGVAVVEGVGGPRSPLAEDGDTVRLSTLIEADVVLLVSDPGLGAINAVLSSVACFDRPTDVLLNRFDENSDLHRLNLEWLEDREKLPVFTKPDDFVRDLFERFPHKLPRSIDSVEVR